MFSTDCGEWPTIDNGIRSNMDVRVVTYDRILTVSAKYVCKDGFVYSKPNSTLTCTDPLLGLDFGLCVKGRF